ncbi:MAG: hypothetical protein E7074_03455 [Bacteroidales bacterium]|nr:hypothetical protein [Bacteroidales bacterium]
MKLNENILRGQELLELGKKLIYGNEETDSLAVIAGVAIIQKAADYLREEYIQEATDIAKGELEKEKKTSGSFARNGITYSVSKSVVYDFVGKPQKYHDADSTSYRENYYKREDLKAAATACTKSMAGDKAQFIVNHPNIEPEKTDYTLNVQFTETAKYLGLKLPEPEKEVVEVKLNEL